MKVILLGGAGFIGSSLINLLSKGDYKLTIYERPQANSKKEYFEGLGIKWVEGSMSSSEEIARAISGFDVVIHLVSSTLPHTSNLNPIMDAQTNLVGTLHLLDAMVSSSVPRLIYLSSGGTVYGNPNDLPISENHPTNPIVSYGIIKLAIEKYALMYQKLFGLRVIILRAANPYGPLQKADSSQGVIRVFLDRALNGKEIEIWGDGSNTRDYLYIDDLADAISKSITYSGDHSIFNIGSGIGASLNDLIKIINSLLGKSIQPTYKVKRQIDVANNILDIRLAHKELHWSPTTNLQEGIKKLFN